MAEGNAERKEVEEYLKRHDLQNLLNEVVNATIKARPDAPLAKMADMLQDKDPRGILAIVGREVLDCRGRPTVEVTVETGLGKFCASVPAGKEPVGPWEAVELRDTDASRYKGGGVTMAVKQVNEVIGPALLGLNPQDQRGVDAKLASLDSSPKFEKLGANAALATSMAVARAGARASKVPLYAHLCALAGFDDGLLPVPAFTMMEGGVSGRLRHPLQEYLLMPVGAETFSEAMRIGVEVFLTLGEMIAERQGSPAIMGATGAWDCPIESVADALTLLCAAVQKCDYTDECKIGLNVAAQRFVVGEPSEGAETFTGDRKYNLHFRTGPDESKSISGTELLNTYNGLIDRFPIVSIEDPFGRNDLPRFVELTTTQGENVQIACGEAIASSKDRLKKCEVEAAGNGLVIVPSQLGTISGVLDLVAVAKKVNWSIMLAHRLGETNDDFIADLAVGLRFGQIRAGPPTSGERLSKYNRLLHIEDEIGASAVYAAHQFRRPPAA